MDTINYYVKIDHKKVLLTIYRSSGHHDGENGQEYDIFRRSVSCCFDEFWCLSASNFISGLGSELVVGKICLLSTLFHVVRRGKLNDD